MTETFRELMKKIHVSDLIPEKVCLMCSRRAGKTQVIKALLKELEKKKEKEKVWSVS